MTDAVSLALSPARDATRRPRREYRLPEKLEVRLLERNDRLINLALASFGTDKEVFKALYKNTLEPTQDETEAQYKRGLRLGCLSNEMIGFVGYWEPTFPDHLIGDDERSRALTLRATCFLD